jgi:hypothetical protein
MLSNKHLLKSTLWLTLAVSLLALVAAQAWSRDYLLELTIYTDKEDRFDLYVEITDRELRDLKQDSQNEIKPYLIEARRQYAEENGYRRDIYGEENYKMVSITRYSFVIKEKSSGRILLSK